MLIREGRDYSPKEEIIRFENLELHADISKPDVTPRGIVLFAHGSGSSRLSSRNRAVAGYLVSQGLITVLMDLLTEKEERVDQITREHRFDIPLLAKRVVAAIDWLSSRPDMKDLPIGLFGASTGAAAALIAAAERKESVAAVVSRGGRADLGGQFLPEVRAPTLLIVGGQDPVVIDMNRQAAQQMQTTIELEIVAGATHLFEEPGTLERVSELASQWLIRHMAQHAS